MFRSLTGFSISARFTRYLLSISSLLSIATTEQLSATTGSRRRLKGSPAQRDELDHGRCLKQPCRVTLGNSGNCARSGLNNPVATRQSPRSLTKWTLAVSFLAILGVPATAKDDFFGVTSHFVLNDRFYPGQGIYWRIDKTLPFMKELGVNTVHEYIYALEASPRALITGTSKDPAVFERVKKNREQFDEWMTYYDRAGIKVNLAILATQPKSDPNATLKNKQFSDWIATLVTNHPSIFAIQLHNEPNLPQFWGKSTADDYVNVYRPIAAAIKSARPDVKIIVGGISALWWQPGVDWLERAAQSGLFKFADGVAVHPYNFSMPPEADLNWKGAPQADPDHLQKALFAFENRIRSWNDQKPLDLYFTELGWNTSSQGLSHVDEKTQADYLGRLLLIYLDSRLKGLPLQSIYWYDLKDDGTNPAQISHRWGLVNYNLTQRKPSFWAMKAITSTFNNVDDFSLYTAKVETSSTLSSIKTLAWKRRSDGSVLLPFWSTSTKSPKAVGTLNLLLRGFNTKAASLHFADERPSVPVDFKQTVDGTSLNVPVSSRAAWVELMPR